MEMKNILTCSILNTNTLFETLECHRTNIGTEVSTSAEIFYNLVKIIHAQNN